MTLITLPILMTIISVMGFIANGKSLEFSAEVLVAICFIAFIIYLVNTIKSIVFNSLNDELTKVFFEFEGAYRVKQKELELLVDNYSKVNFLKDDLMNLTAFLNAKLSNIIELRKTMLSNHVNKLIKSRLNSIIQEESAYVNHIHNSLVSDIITVYGNINKNYSKQKVWSDNIANLSKLSNKKSDLDEASLKIVRNLSILSNA